jgi:hypothetical protein
MIPLFMMFAGGPIGTGRQWLFLFPFQLIPFPSRQMDLISAFNFGMQKLPPLQKLPTAFTDLVPYIFNELIIARFSWIHLDDLVNLIYESLTNPAYKGDLKSTTAHSLIPPFSYLLLELHVQSTPIVYYWWYTIKDELLLC